MKFLALATTALAAAPLAKRDAAKIAADVAALSDKVTALQTIVNNFTGASDADKLVAASEDIIAAIKQGTADTDASEPLDTLAASTLIDPITALTKVIQDTISTLNSKKSIAEGTGRGCEVEPQLVEQKKDTQAFSDALAGKVDPLLKDAVAQLSAPILAALQSGIDAYKDVKCSTTTTSSPGSTTTSSPGSTTTSSPGSATTTAPGTTTKSSSATGTGPWSTGHHGNGTATETDLTTVTTSVCPTTSAGTTLVTVPTSATGGAGNPPATGGNGGSPTQGSGGGSPTQIGGGSTQPPVIPVGAGVALRGELPFAMAIALIAAAIL